MMDGERVRAGLDCSRAQKDALNEIGFSWCKEDEVMIRIHPSASATVTDLVSIDAVRTSYAETGSETGECVLRARAYLATTLRAV